MAIISDAPHTENEARKIANRVGFIKKTHYGEEFIVKAKEGTSNVAYLSSTLQLHSDLPYYEYKPGSNLLHCLVQAKGEGGRSKKCLTQINTQSFKFFLTKNLTNVNLT